MILATGSVKLSVLQSAYLAVTWVKHMLGVKYLTVIKHVVSLNCLCCVGYPSI